MFNFSLHGTVSTRHDQINRTSLSSNNRLSTLCFPQGHHGGTKLYQPPMGHPAHCDTARPCSISCQPSCLHGPEVHCQAWSHQDENACPSLRRERASFNAGRAGPLKLSRHLLLDHVLPHGVVQAAPFVSPGRMWEYSTEENPSPRASVK